MGIGSRLFLIIFISLGLGIFVSYIIAERDITDTFQKHIINELQNQASLLAEVVDEVDSIGDLNEADSLADRLGSASNVYGMGSYADGGIFSTKPYICGSSYMLRMSNYSKGDWCDTVDGLYWRFVEKNIKFFESNPRLAVMTRSLTNMNKERKKTIFKSAEEFIDRNTA